MWLPLTAYNPTETRPLIRTEPATHNPQRTRVFFGCRPGYFYGFVVRAGSDRCRMSLIGATAVFIQ